MLDLIDRGDCNYGLMRDIMEEKSSFLCRLPNNASCEVLEERAVTDEAHV
jgi:hypothetical protein